MKMKLTKLFIASCLPLFMSAQSMNNCVVANSDTAYLHGNAIKTIISADGSLFWDGANAQFWVPYNSGSTQQTSTIFAGGLWIGGYDSGGNLKLAAQTYNQSGADYFYGPLDSVGTTNSNVCGDYNRVWRVDAPMVQAHLQHYIATGGNVTQVDSILLAWPGRNNPHLSTTLGFSLPANRDFAPFYDKNGDNIYNPFDGDYPVFDSNDSTAIASSMTWNIYNDNGNIHASTGGQALLVEVHQTAYALNCPNDPLLNHTIFIRQSIVSRNTLALFDVRAGLWFDFDLGCYQDDYAGTAVGHNAVFAYNGDANDELNCGFGTYGYGVKPPVQSAMLLNQNLYKSMYYENSTDPQRGNPGTAIQHYRLINGQFLNGTTAPDYMYDGMPSDTSASANTMVHAAAVPNDFRNLMVVNLDTLRPNAVHHIDVAYVYHRDSSLADNIEMTDLVYSELPIVQGWYDNGFPASCFPAQTLAVRQALNANASLVRLFPNPNTGSFSIETPSEQDYQLQIFDMTGRLLYEKALRGANTYSVELPSLAAGMYFYQLANEKESYSGKLLIKQ